MQECVGRVSGLSGIPRVGEAEQACRPGSRRHPHPCRQQPGGQLQASGWHQWTLPPQAVPEQATRTPLPWQCLPCPGSRRYSNNSFERWRGTACPDGKPTLMRYLASSLCILGLPRQADHILGACIAHARAALLARVNEPQQSRVDDSQDPWQTSGVKCRTSARLQVHRYLQDLGQELPLPEGGCPMSRQAWAAWGCRRLGEKAASIVSGRVPWSEEGKYRRRC